MTAVGSYGCVVGSCGGGVVVAVVSIIIIIINRGRRLG